MSRQNKLCIASQRHAKIKSLTKRPGQTCIDVSLANNWLFFPLWIIQIIFFQAIPDILNQSGRARLWHSKRKHHISQWLKTQRCISGSDYIRCSGWQKAPLHIPLLGNPDVQSPHYMKCRLLTKKKKKKGSDGVIRMQVLKAYNQKWSHFSDQSKNHTYRKGSRGIFSQLSGKSKTVICGEQFIRK